MTAPSSVQRRVPAELDTQLAAAGVSVADAVRVYLGSGPTSSVSALNATVSARSARAVSTPVQSPSLANTPRTPTRTQTAALATQRAIRLASTAAATVGIAAAALAVRASADFVERSGVATGPIRFLFPVALEGSMLAASVAVWTRVGNRVLSWCVLTTATVLSVAANVLHVPSSFDGVANRDVTAGRVFAAVPPLAFLAAIEIVASIRARRGPT